VKTRNPRLDRHQMTSGQVWPVGRWSEVMLDQLLRSTVGLTGPRTDDTSASRWQKQGSAQREPPHSLLVRSEHVEGSSRYDRLRLVAGETGCARYALKEHFTPWPRCCGVCR
jgi:hypothetical protein